MRTLCDFTTPSITGPQRERSCITMPLTMSSATKCIESGSSREKWSGERSLSLRSSARGVVTSMRRMWLLLALEGVRTSAHELAAAHGSTTTHKGSAARMQRRNPSSNIAELDYFIEPSSKTLERSTSSRKQSAPEIVSPVSRLPPFRTRINRGIGSGPRSTLSVPAATSKNAHIERK